MGRLDGKVAIVTGAARGQGASHVRKFVQEGAKVVFTDILVEQGEALAKELGSNVRFMKHDVANEADWEKVVEETEKVFGPVNILVNNAGIFAFGMIADLSVEAYMKVININQVSVFLGMKTVLPSMHKTKNGSIINISSINGMVGGPGTTAYTATKFAVRGMTKAAALELASTGIRVNSIHPGAIATPMIIQEDTKDAVKEMAKSIPLGRVGTSEEVSNLVVFLASDESSYSTGSEFVIDGGVTAQ